MEIVTPSTFVRSLAHTNVGSYFVNDTARLLTGAQPKLLWVIMVARHRNQTGCSLGFRFWRFPSIQSKLADAQRAIPISSTRGLLDAFLLGMRSASETLPRPRIWVHLVSNVLWQGLDHDFQSLGTKVLVSNMKRILAIKVCCHHVETYRVMGLCASM